MTRTSTENFHRHDHDALTLRIHGVDLTRKFSASGIPPWLRIVLQTLDVHLDDQPSIFNKKMRTGAQILVDLCAACNKVNVDYNSVSFGQNVWQTRINQLSDTLISLNISAEMGYRSSNPKASAVPKRNALNGLLVQEHPTDGNPYAQFKDRLRAWLLFKAFDISEKHQCFADTAVIETARYLSYWVNQANVGWTLTNTIAEQVASSDTFSYFSPWIFERSLWSVVAGMNTEVLSAQDSQFIGNLVSIMQGETSHYDGTGAYQPPVYAGLPVDVSAGELSPSTELFDVDDQILFSEFGDRYFEPNYDNEAYTSEEQRISAHSLLRQSAEEHHYLPSSWCYLQNEEFSQLLNWIDRQLQSANPHDALGAVLTVVALLTSSSLQFVCEFPLSGREAGWYLDLDTGGLKRSVPRYNNAWTPQEADRAYIKPSTSEHHLKLVHSVLDTVNDVLKENPNCKTLGQLWTAVSSVKLKSWFTRQMNEAGLRISSSMLAKILPYDLYQSTGSVTIARLFGAHPQTTLTGAAAYVAASPASIDLWWEGAELKRFGTFVWETIDCNVLGSQMVLLPAAVAKDVQHAITRLSRLRSGNPIDFHNAYTEYCVYMLLAATGARPVNDPFESLADFSFEFDLIAIDDKADASNSSVRLAPLGHIVRRQIQDHYLKHLNTLSESVSVQLPGFSRQLKDMLFQRRSESLPLFFFLRSDGVLEHISLNQTKSDDAANSLSCSESKSLFKWPLPANLFRHHFIQSLMSSGVEPEVVEGWAGHIEHGVSSYGDYSERCWWEDAREVQPVLDRMLKRLGFEEVSGFTHPVHFKNLRADSTAETEAFGRARRAQKRDKKKKAILAEVDKLVDFHFNNSEDPLSQPSVNELSIAITSVSLTNSMLRPYAWLSFDQMLTRLDEYALSTGETVPRIRRGALRPTRAKTHFTLQSPLSLERFNRLTEALKEQVESARWSPERVGGGMAAVLGAALLCIENRLSHNRLLSDVVAIRNFRLITTAGEFYIEHDENLDPSDLFQPVQRYAIPVLTARYLDRALAAKGAQRGDGYRALKPLINSLSLEITPRDALTVFAKIIRDTNAIMLPGFMAAALDGRTLVTSLPLQDWYRFKTSQQLDMPGCRALMYDQLKCESITDKNQSTAAPNSFNAVAFWTQTSFQLKDALDYKTSLMTLIGGYTRSTGGARNRLRSALKSLEHKYSQRVNQTVLSIGRWIDFRVAEGNKKRSGKSLAQNTLKTYASAVSTLISIGHQIDITLLDSDGITDLYLAFLEAKRSSVEDLVYFKERLLDYHNFMTRFVGIEQPDWGVLQIDAATRGVSPGAIRTVEYDEALRKLQSLEGLEQLQKDYISWLLIVGYRFGLRPNEAIHLRKCDCIFEGNVLYLSVLPYRGHELKTKGSRRLMENIDPLTGTETEVIERVIAQFSPLKAHQSDALYTVLSEADIEGFLSGALGTINDVLRATTGNEHLIYYHLRHTHLNQLSASVLDVKSQLWIEQRLTRGRKEVRGLTLGARSSTSRRTLLGIGRRLGHVIPATSLRSYNHLISDHIDVRLGIKETTQDVLPNVINLDVLPTIAREQRELQSVHKPTLALVTPANVLKCLEHMSRGYSAAKAMQIVNFPEYYAPLFYKAVRTVESTLWFSQSQASSICGRDAPLLLLERLAVNYWQEMIEVAERHSTDIESCQTSQTTEDSVVRMVGQDRQILMKHDFDFDLVMYVIRIFEIPLSTLQIHTRGDDQDIYSRIERYGLSSCLQTPGDQVAQINASRSPGNHYDRRYAALIYNGDGERAIKNRNSFVIALIACHLVVMLPR